MYNFLNFVISMFFFEFEQTICPWTSLSNTISFQLLCSKQYLIKKHIPSVTEQTTSRNRVEIMMSTSPRKPLKNKQLHRVFCGTKKTRFPSVKKFSNWELLSPWTANGAAFSNLLGVGVRHQYHMYHTSSTFIQVCVVDGGQ